MGRPQKLIDTEKVLGKQSGRVNDYDEKFADYEEDITITYCICLNKNSCIYIYICKNFVDSYIYMYMNRSSQCRLIEHVLFSV